MTDGNNVIITKADKGGAIVITDVEHYVKEAEHQLNNKDVHKKHKHDTTKIHTRLVNVTKIHFNNDELITENTVEVLHVQQPETPKLYTLPKIYKTVKPGRRVISSKNCHTSTISKYVDFHL